MSTKVVVTMDALGHGVIKIDGHDMSRATRGFTLTSEAGQPVKIEIDLCVSEVEITGLGDSDAVMLVNLYDEVISALLAIGWTPPADDNRIYRIARPLWEPSMSVDLNTRPADYDPDILDNESPDAND